MKYFIVRGEISYDDPSDVDGYSIKEVEVRIEARTATDAPDAALIELSTRYPAPYWCGDWPELVGMPSGIEAIIDDGDVPEALLMRRMGAPELPGVTE